MCAEKLFEKILKKGLTFSVYRYILIYRNRETQARKEQSMRTYYIYNADVDETEYIGKVEATIIINAEIKAYRELKATCNVYALTTAPGEAWA